MWSGLFMLLVLSTIMTIASFLAGSLPLSFSLSQRQLRLTTAIGTGVLVGTALIVIIPEGIETLYSAREVSHAHVARSLSLNTRSQNGLPDVLPFDLSRRDFPTLDLHIRDTDLTGPDDGRPGDGQTSSQEPDHKTEEHKSEDHDDWEPHAWIGVSLVLGFVLMYLIDQLPRHAAASSQPQRFHIALDRFNLQRSTNQASEVEDPDGPPPDPMHESRPSSTTVGLVIHAAADGIALGASSSASSRRLGFIVFVALMIHKAPAAFGLTSALLKQGLSKRRARNHLIVFSLAAPIGALFTWALVNIFEGGIGQSEHGTRFFTGLLLLFSGGTFLYVAMHAMQDTKHGHDMGNATPNGYSDPNVYDGYQSASTKQEGPVLSDTLAVISASLAPTLDRHCAVVDRHRPRQPAVRSQIRPTTRVDSIRPSTGATFPCTRQNNMEDPSDWHPSYPQTQRPLSMPVEYDPEAASGSEARIFGQRHHKPQTSISRPSARSISSSSTSVPIPIPSNPNVIPGNLLPSAPASPPTPAPSPTPGRRLPSWASTTGPSLDLHMAEDGDLDDIGSEGTFGLDKGLRFRHMKNMFSDMDNDERKRILTELLANCDGKLLGYVANFVAPRLKRDPFGVLPNELCLRILTFIDDAKTLARSSQVSKRWHELVSDDMAWKSLCEKHAYRRMSDDTPSTNTRQQHSSPYEPSQSGSSLSFATHALRIHNPAFASFSTSTPDLSRVKSLDRTTSAPVLPSSAIRRRPQAMTYRSHFKQKYQVETAWRTGGKVDQRQITPDQGVVTSLHLTDKYIIVALDNAKIHVFDTEGKHLRCLQGHVMGVWAMVPWGETLVSGGCDRDVRVWNMATGQPLHMLRGHTSTVRCLKMSNATTAISGSRDTTLRIWDIEKGQCKHVLMGHQASVRCLEIHGDLVVSGSYDTTARIWSISEGRCLRTLQGHFSQIYAVAFDGKRVATGSLDTSVRVWNVADGKCLAILQGHTSLVGQLQLRGDTLVTGGSDGSVRVWSLQSYTPIHRLAAH
ncbi:WD40 repeat-like protein, partial [Aureobasidium melanogenum]